MDQLPIVSTPLLEHFEDQEVPLYELNGKMYLAGEGLGKILGLAEPRKAIAKIYQRNREELQPHVRDTKMVSPSSTGTRSGGPQTIRLYSEIGCYLITMFAKTKKARQVRVWLASLPQRLRKTAPLASNQTTPAGNSMLEALEREYFHGFCQAVKMFLDINTTRMDISRLLSVIHWRVLGWPQAEVAKVVGLSLFTVQKYEKLLRDHGMVFPRGKEMMPVSGFGIGKILREANKEQARRGRLRRIK